MIACFPTPYEDELAYSVFARYYARSGYLNYVSVAEDLYVHPTLTPNVELLNLLTKDAIQQIGSVNDFVAKHTMFGYYSAYLPPERQRQARAIARRMSAKELVDALPLPTGRQARRLRYCPVCVTADRVVYGETYWHRAHQLYGIPVCPVHGCILHDSRVSIASNVTPALINAEEVVEIREPQFSDHQLTKDIAKYANDILRYSTISKSSSAEFLKHKLIGTKYLSARGVKRNIELLSRDFKAFYEGFDTLGFCAPWQFEKVFSGYRVNPFELSLLAYFLGISVKEVTTRRISKPYDHKAFDEQIYHLRNQGFNYRETSQMLGMSYDYIKALAYRQKRVLDEGG